MKLKFYKLTFLSLCIWNYAQAAIKITDDDISDVIDSCDYTRFDNQLIKLQIGNDILQHNMSDMHKDLGRQKDILSDLERTIKSLPQQIQTMQDKLMQNNRQNFEDLKDFIRKEIQMQTTMMPPPVDDKIIFIADMRETLKKHDKMLEEITKNQNQSQKLLNEMNLEKHTQVLKNTISEKLGILPQIDAKLNVIENSNNIPIISNQENIKSLLKEINLALQNTISEKLAIMPQIDTKLNVIENTISSDVLNDVVRNQENISSLLKEINLEKHTQALTNTISDKLAILSQYFHQIDATKIFLKDDNQILTCTSKSYPTSCADFDAAVCEDSKCPIINNLYGPKAFVVACNNSIDGGGWTIIQRRINGAVDFYRNWLEYKHGFGDIDAEFFIGLEKLHVLTSTLQPVELLIQLQDFENVIKYAKYDDFQVGNETENYKLIKVGLYVGDAGDSFSQHVGYSFSTKDRDNDVHPNINCAQNLNAAWWYKKCYFSNLNGKYYQHPTKFYNATLKNHGINWNKFHGDKYSLMSVQMLIRPRKF